LSKILIVHAHPEPKSLTSALKDFAVASLTSEGHTVQESDLYAMGWKATADGGDFTDQSPTERLRYAAASGKAYAQGTQTADVIAEQQKLLWADGVILSFPLWWFGMPAILKGWVDRVFARGFAYGVGQHGGERWGDRYGEGILKGRRAMVTISIGGREPHYSDRGVNGRLYEILWPIQHGVLFYPGMDVLPPFPIFQSDRLTDEGWAGTSAAYAERLRGFFQDAPIAFRAQNGGHYDAQQVLKPDLGTGQDGLMVHLKQPGDPQESFGSTLDTAVAGAR